MKATDDGKAWFDELLPTDQDVVRRPMFGNLAGFVNGNMFLCLFGEDVAVRLDETGRDELYAEGGSPFEPMEGRPMKEYVVLPRGFRTDLTRATGWVARSLEHARAMPPKAPKKAAQKKAAAKR